MLSESFTVAPLGCNCVILGDEERKTAIVVDTVEKGDHSLFVGEVVNAGVTQQPEGRADDATLWLKDLGEKVFYGG